MSKTNGLIGKKIGMMTIFTASGKSLPVTALKVGPCTVTQIKNKNTDGYDSLQLGFGEKKKTRVNKPEKGHLAKSGENYYAVLREFFYDCSKEYKIGQKISLAIFDVGEKVNIVGVTKGRGFSGVMKRHGFHGGGNSHGSHSKRIPGSIGCSAWPAKVIKGKKMPGRYGCDKMTIKNLEIVEIRNEENIILIKGAVPGFNSGLVKVLKKNK